MITNSGSEEKHGSSRYDEARAYVTQGKSSLLPEALWGISLMAIVAGSVIESWPKTDHADDEHQPVEQLGASFNHFSVQISPEEGNLGEFIDAIREASPNQSNPVPVLCWSDGANGATKCLVPTP